ncbi:MAG: hypothetical protein P4M11_08480 [Candidatus Pacebacteria bacterium]|nr:hypothetical protein [Candidatus Paceibacterota bacterium]
MLAIFFAALNHNNKGIILLSFIFAMGCVDVYLGYHAKTYVSKLTSTINHIFGMIYAAASVLLVFLFLINFFSFINGLSSSTSCVEEDETCVLITPYGSHQANNIFNEYPVSYRVSRDNLKTEVRAWASENGYYSRELEDGTIHIVIVTYLTFLNDMKVYIKTCSENEYFSSIVAHAQLRVGYKDFGNELEERVRRLYEYLQSKHRPTEYSYTFCITREDIASLIR